MREGAPRADLEEQAALSAAWRAVGLATWPVGWGWEWPPGARDDEAAYAWDGTPPSCEWTRDASSLFSEITFLCEENRGGIGIARDAPQEMAKVTWLK